MKEPGKRESAWRQTDTHLRVTFLLNFPVSLGIHLRKVTLSSKQQLVAAGYNASETGRKTEGKDLCAKSADHVSEWLGPITCCYVTKWPGRQYIMKQIRLNQACCSEEPFTGVLTTLRKSATSQEIALLFSFLARHFWQGSSKEMWRNGSRPIIKEPEKFGHDFHNEHMSTFRKIGENFAPIDESLWTRVKRTYPDCSVTYLKQTSPVILGKQWLRATQELSTGGAGSKLKQGVVPWHNGSADRHPSPNTTYHLVYRWVRMWIIRIPG